MTKKKTRSAKKKTPAKPNLDDFLKAFMTPRITILDYQDMKRLCTGFAETLMQKVGQTSTPLEKEMMSHASSEIFDMLKNKYSIEALDASVLLINMGMDLLNGCDDFVDGMME